VFVRWQSYTRARDVPKLFAVQVAFISPSIVGGKRETSLLWKEPLFSSRSASSRTCSSQIVDLVLDTQLGEFDFIRLAFISHDAY
jgi:hypothetical protein